MISMKNKIYIVLAVLGVLALGGCQKEMPPLYGDTHGVYVQYGIDGEVEEIMDSIIVSFSARIEPEYTVYVRVMTKGRLDFDRDRYFNVIALDAESDAAQPIDGVSEIAQPSEFEIGQGVVKAGDFFGTVPITVKKSARVTEGTTVQTTIQLVPSEDFPYVGTKVKVNDKDDFKLNYKIKWSNLIEMPSNWYSGGWGAMNVFGTWSRPKFQYILETLGPDDVPNWEPQAPNSSFANRDHAIALRIFLEGKLRQYKENSELDPAAYPPIYVPGTSEWIDFGK